MDYARLVSGGAFAALLAIWVFAFQPTKEDERASMCAPKSPRWYLLRVWNVIAGGYIVGSIVIVMLAKQEWLAWEDGDDNFRVPGYCLLAGLGVGIVMALWTALMNALITLGAGYLFSYIVFSKGMSWWLAGLSAAFLVASIMFLTCFAGAFVALKFLKKIPSDPGISFALCWSAVMLVCGSGDTCGDPQFPTPGLTALLFGMTVPAFVLTLIRMLLVTRLWKPADEKRPNKDENPKKRHKRPVDDEPEPDEAGAFIEPWTAPPPPDDYESQHVEPWSTEYAAEYDGYTQSPWDACRDPPQFSYRAWH
jgi:hypothetical protein